MFGNPPAAIRTVCARKTTVAPEKVPQVNILRGSWPPTRSSHASADKNFDQIRQTINPKKITGKATPGGTGVGQSRGEPLPNW
ncbi:hypothetical protein GCM10009628_04310 [Paeniglutamicibacter kerguelensis]